MTNTAWTPVHMYHYVKKIIAGDAGDLVGVTIDQLFGISAFAIHRLIILPVNHRNMILLYNLLW